MGGYSPQRKAINYELANDGIPQAVSCMKHGIVEGCNTALFDAIDKADLINKYDGNYKLDILNAIKQEFETNNEYGTDLSDDTITRIITGISSSIDDAMKRNNSSTGQVALNNYVSDHKDTAAKDIFSKFPMTEINSYFDKATDKNIT